MYMRIRYGILFASSFILFALFYALDNVSIRKCLVLDFRHVLAHVMRRLSFRSRRDPLKTGLGTIKATSLPDIDVFLYETSYTTLPVRNTACRVSQAIYIYSLPVIKAIYKAIQKRNIGILKTDFYLIKVEANMSKIRPLFIRGNFISSS